MDEKQVQALLKVAYEIGRSIAIDEWEKGAAGAGKPAPQVDIKTQGSVPPRELPKRGPSQRSAQYMAGQAPDLPKRPTTRFAQPGPRMTSRFTRAQRGQAGRK